MHINMGGIAARYETNGNGLPVTLCLSDSSRTITFMMAKSKDDVMMFEALFVQAKNNLANYFAAHGCSYDEA